MEKQETCVANLLPLDVLRMILSQVCDKQNYLNMMLVCNQWYQCMKVLPASWNINCVRMKLHRICECDKLPPNRRFCETFHQGYPDKKYYFTDGYPNANARSITVLTDSERNIKFNLYSGVIPIDPMIEKPVYDNFNYRQIRQYPLIIYLPRLFQDNLRYSQNQRGTLVWERFDSWKYLENVQTSSELFEIIRYLRITSYPPLSIAKKLLPKYAELCKNFNYKVELRGQIHVMITIRDITDFPEQCSRILTVLLPELGNDLSLEPALSYLSFYASQVIVDYSSNLDWMKILPIHPNLAILLSNDKRNANYVNRYLRWFETIGIVNSFYPDRIPYPHYPDAPSVYQNKRNFRDMLIEERIAMVKKFQSQGWDIHLPFSDYLQVSELVVPVGYDVEMASFIQKYYTKKKERKSHYSILISRLPHPFSSRIFNILLTYIKKGYFMMEKIRQFVEKCLTYLPITGLDAENVLYLVEQGYVTMTAEQVYSYYPIKEVRFTSQQIYDGFLKPNSDTTHSCQRHSQLRTHLLMFRILRRLEGGIISQESLIKMIYLNQHFKQNNCPNCHHKEIYNGIPTHSKRKQPG